MKGLLKWIFSIDQNPNSKLKSHILYGILDFQSLISYLINYFISFNYFLILTLRHFKKDTDKFSGL